MGVSEELHFRFASESDVDLYYRWANDEEVRKNSFNQEEVIYENHVKWFHSKLASKDCFFFLFLDKDNIPVGQVRIDKSAEETVVGISIDKQFRGRSLGAEMLKQATNAYFKEVPSSVVIAYIKQDNLSSFSIFKKAGFGNEETVTEKGCVSYKLYIKDPGR
jgi:RimJ/RimL family protein N-acetyltransferase